VFLSYSALLLLLMLQCVLFLNCLVSQSLVRCRCCESVLIGVFSQVHRQGDVITVRPCRGRPAPISTGLLCSPPYSLVLKTQEGKRRAGDVSQESTSGISTHNLNFELIKLTFDNISCIFAFLLLRRCMSRSTCVTARILVADFAP
jgi:hypothetical protein